MHLFIFKQYFYPEKIQFQEKKFLELEAQIAVLMYTKEERIQVRKDGSVWLEKSCVIMKI